VTGAAGEATPADVVMAAQGGGSEVAVAGVEIAGAAVEAEKERLASQKAEEIARAFKKAKGKQKERTKEKVAAMAVEGKQPTPSQQQAPPSKKERKERTEMEREREEAIEGWKEGNIKGSLGDFPSFGPLHPSHMLLQCMLMLSVSICCPLSVPPPLPSTPSIDSGRWRGRRRR